jgi:hypothetical protein
MAMLNNQMVTWIYPGVKIEDLEQIRGISFRFDECWSHEISGRFSWPFHILFYVYRRICIQIYIYISYMDYFPLSAISKISTSICLIQVSHQYDLYHHHWRHVYSSSNKQWPVLDTIQKISSSVHILLIAVFHIYCHYYKQWPVEIHTCMYIYILLYSIRKRSKHPFSAGLLTLLVGYPQNMAMENPPNIIILSH